MNPGPSEPEADMLPSEPAWRDFKICMNCTQLVIHNGDATTRTCELCEIQYCIFWHIPYYNFAMKFTNSRFYAELNMTYEHQFIIFIGYCEQSITKFFITTVSINFFKIRTTTLYCFLVNNTHITC